MKRRMSLRTRLSVLPLVLALACQASPAPGEGDKADDKTENADKPKGGELGGVAPGHNDPAVAADGTKKLDIKKLEPPKITLLEVGSDPEVLRLHPTVGTAEGMKMTMKMDMNMGQGMPTVSMPPIVTMAVSNTDRIEGDRIFASVDFESMKVEAQPDTPKMMVDQLNATLDGFKAFRAQLELDNQGALHGGTVDAPQGLPAPLQQTMNQMQENFGKVQVPLPAEAVGVGGKWIAVSVMEQGGMKLEQSATYELLARDGDALKLKVDVDQKLLSESFSPPGMPGVTGTIDRYEGGGSGKLDLLLSSLMPTKSSMKVDVDLAMTIEVLGQTQKQAMKMGVLVDIERVER